MYANRYDSDLREWADTHETSIEVAVAICEHAGGSETRMERLWDNPTETEAATIEGRAWSLDEDDQRELEWGETTIYRR